MPNRDYYLEKDNEEACGKYTKALDTCPLVFTEVRAVLFGNRGAARLAAVSSV